MSNNRVAKLIKLTESTAFNAFALNPGPTLAYLTGLEFHLMERPTVAIFPRAGKPALILAQLEASRAEEIPFPVQLFTYNDDPSTWGDAFSKAVRFLEIDDARIGVESTRLRVLELRYLESAAPGSKFISADKSLSELRIQKDSSEIALMRKAVQIAQDALKAILPLLKVGATERQVASELSLQLLKAGSDGELPFPPIVAGGPNGANSHATPTDRPFQPGDLVVIDWGARYHGYISDLTRTFAIGQPDPELIKVAKLVEQANAAGRAASRPGVTAGSIDIAARQVIEQGGYGDYFTHRTGHGIGMEAHEEPYIYGSNDLMLMPGMTFTIEPGIYLQGRAGVRIEDNVAITSNGAETLSDLPRELQIIK